MKKKTASLVCYITLIGWFMAYNSYKHSKKSSLLKFHLKQSLGLGIISIITNLVIILIELFFNYPISLVILLNNMLLFILWIAGITSALYGVRLPLPIIGSLFEDKFSFIE